jgi:hypothetical protein
MSNKLDDYFNTGLEGMDLVAIPIRHFRIDQAATWVLLAAIMVFMAPFWVLGQVCRWLSRE